MAPTLTEVLTVAQCTRDDFNNWKRRGALKTKLPDAVAGVAQYLSRRNAIELAFLSALTAVGYGPAEAVAETARWLKEEAAETLAPAWAGNPNSGRRGKPVQLGMGFSNLEKADVASLAVMLADKHGAGWVGDAESEMKPATTIAIINRAEIVRRVDELFA